MASANEGRKSGATREGGRNVSPPARAMSDAADVALDESQRFVRAWAAAYSASVRGWADVMRVSAETAANTAKAFDEAFREKQG